MCNEITEVDNKGFFMFSCFAAVLGELVNFWNDSILRQSQFLLDLFDFLFAHAFPTLKTKKTVKSATEELGQKSAQVANNPFLCRQGERQSQCNPPLLLMLLSFSSSLLSWQTTNIFQWCNVILPLLIPQLCWNTDHVSCWPLL